MVVPHVSPSALKHFCQQKDPVGFLGQLHDTHTVWNAGSEFCMQQFHFQTELQGQSHSCTVPLNPSEPSEIVLPLRQKDEVQLTRRVAFLETPREV